MLVHNIEDVRIAVFPTVSDLIATFDGREPNYVSADSTWSGAASNQQAIEILRNGWTHGRQTVDRVAGRLESSLQQVAKDLVQEMTYDVAGAYPDMGRFFEGEPECMVQFVPTDDVTVGQVTRILVDCGASQRYSADWMTERAAAIAALVQVLSMVGKSVEIWVASPVTFSANDKKQDTLVCVHQAGQTVNVDSIAFALGHPAMLRRLIFDVRCDDTMSYGADVATRSGLGRTCEHLQETIDYVKPHVVIQRVENSKPGVPDPVSNPLEWVKHHLHELGLLS
jgi:hypothetical protein